MKTLCIDNDCDRGMRRGQDITYADTYEQVISALASQKFDTLEIFRNEDKLAEKIIQFLAQNKELAPVDIVICNAVDPLEEIQLKIRYDIPLRRWGDVELSPHRIKPLASQPVNKYESISVEREVVKKTAEDRDLELKERLRQSGIDEARVSEVAEQIKEASSQFTVCPVGDEHADLDDFIDMGTSVENMFEDDEEDEDEV